uniref:Lipoprotein n=1 Tax=Cacopsylla melanoneura TaxID=428564 RepID=A0A8D8X3R5_9HEMI
MCLFTNRMLCLLVLGVLSLFSLASCWKDIDLKDPQLLKNSGLNLTQFIGKNLCATNNEKLCTETFHDKMEKYWFKQEHSFRTACETDKDLGVLVCWLRQRERNVNSFFMAKETVYELQFWTDSMNVTHMRYEY